MPSIYVAGSSLELPPIRLLMRQIADTSPAWQLAYDWPAAIAKAGAANADLSTFEKNAARIEAVSAIRGCDAFVLVAPLDPTPTAGCFVEFGIALSQIGGIPIAILGEWESVFATGAAFQTNSAREILAWLHEVL